LFVDYIQAKRRRNHWQQQSHRPKNDIDKTNIRPVRPEDADLVGVTPAPILKSLIPKKYSDPDKSGLLEEVKKGQNTFAFELKD